MPQIEFTTVTLPITDIESVYKLATQAPPGCMITLSRAHDPDDGHALTVVSWRDPATGRLAGGRF